MNIKNTEILYYYRKKAIKFFNKMFKEISGQKAVF